MQMFNSILFHNKPMRTAHRRGLPSAGARSAAKNRLSSVAALTTEFQTASGSNVSTINVCRELREMGFHGREAAYKPKITMEQWKLEFSGVMNHT
jgi:hypothetical protein